MNHSVISQLDSSSLTPLYRQLSNIIRSQIESGEYSRDEKIPTEIELSESYGISRITVRKALEELTDEGLLVRKPGKGTFVCIDKSIRTSYPRMPFKEAVERSGRVATTKLLSYSLEVPPKKIANFLKLKEHEEAIIIKRLRLADDIPVHLETLYFPKSFDFLAGEGLGKSINEALLKHNITPCHGTSTISICFATEEEVALFNIENDSPLLYVYNELSDQNHRPVQVSKEIIRSDIYKLVMMT
ncbi:MAG: GntR family transcriptional regulator [Blautia sp.]|jgi:GntR family transcriptional regulator